MEANYSSSNVEGVALWFYSIRILVGAEALYVLRVSCTRYLITRMKYYRYLVPVTRYTV